MQAAGILAWEKIPLQPCRRSLYRVVMVFSARFVEVRSSRRCLIKKSVIAVQQPCQAVSLLHLHLVLVVVPLLVAKPRVDWLVRWLVLWRRGRVRCRILVSTLLENYIITSVRLTTITDDEKDDDDW